MYDILYTEIKCFHYVYHSPLHLFYDVVIIVCTHKYTMLSGKRNVKLNYILLNVTPCVPKYSNRL